VAVLDETFFYPESGGQLSDRGSIAGITVLDVWEDGDVVCHRLEAAVRPGAVECVIDGEHRFDHMQQHTGQHVLSRAFIEVAGLNTVSFHMGEDACTIDLDGDVAEDMLNAAERVANAIIWDNRPVHVRTVSKDKLDDAGLRKKIPEDVTDVRLVEVADFDVIGCCGTHVRHTGELGLIKVLKHEKVKGAARVSFKVGKRALDDFAVKHGVVKTLSTRFTTSVDGIVDKVAKLQGESQQNRKELQRLSKRLAAREAGDLVDSAEEHGGVRCIVRLLSGYNAEYVRTLSSELKTVSRTMNMLATDSGAVVCNAANDVEVDFSLVIEQAKELGGSGGGKGGFATVMLPDGHSPEAFLAGAFEALKKIL
jgi:alanyl-tRNA synthetase